MALGIELLLEVGEKGSHNRGVRLFALRDHKIPARLCCMGTSLCSPRLYCFKGDRSNLRFEDLQLNRIGGVINQLHRPDQPLGRNTLVKLISSDDVLTIETI